MSPTATVEKVELIAIEGFYAPFPEDVKEQISKLDPEAAKEQLFHMDPEEGDLFEMAIEYDGSEFEGDGRRFYGDNKQEFRVKGEIDGDTIELVEILPENEEVVNITGNKGFATTYFFGYLDNINGQREVRGFYFTGIEKLFSEGSVKPDGFWCGLETKVE